jgi:hypothetical protein
VGLGHQPLRRGPGLLGAYWVLRPDRGQSAANDAKAFVARLNDECPGWRNGPFILQLDCEKWNDDSATVPTKAYIQQFCNQLRASTPKLMPIVYAPEWVYGDTLKGLGYPLWAPTEGTPPVATTPAATLNDADLHKIFYTDGLIPAPANADSADTNPDWTLRGALQDTGFQLRTIEQQNEALAAQITALAEAVAALTPPPAA